jgi:glutamine synthetase
MEAINKQALRILRIFDTPASRVETTLGPEQEYFLIEKDLADARPDILLTGRTVFGAPPAKGQEMDDHYFGTIKERAAAFMKEFNYELWKLGISAKTQHNEVAPNQFEIAPIFDAANAASDKNHLLMDVLKKVAGRHNLVALLHEKPFAGVNGSGKHNNWSLSTDKGLNLLDPGDNPHENAQFLVFLSAIIRAVDKYAALLRTSAANSGNDHRLGANEAPPAIISIFLGDILSGILEGISEDRPVKSASGEILEIGITRLPNLPKDLSDRNRTSPFAFTGNKFEFRMVASSASVATPTTALNTAVADVLAEFADELEKAPDLNSAVQDLIKKTYKNHKRIIFNGNGYSDDWVTEAEKRGLPNIRSTVEAIPEYIRDTTIALFTRHGVLSKEELESRTHVYLEKYSQQINIEANVMVEMAKRDILPSGVRFASELAESVVRIKNAGPDLPVDSFAGTLKEATAILKEFQIKTAELEVVLDRVRNLPSENILAIAHGYREMVIPAMEELRVLGDKLEVICPRDLWPFPSYMDLLFKL